MLRSVALILVLTAWAIPAGAVIIGHADVDGVPSLPLSVMDAVGEQRWLFTHASVGANMLDGMQALGTEDPLRYQFDFQVAGDWSQVYPPPSPTVPGTIYDGARGNPGWAAKFAMFDAAVRDLGWRYPVVDAAMDKLCYIDPEADVSVYLSMMTALEADVEVTTTDGRACKASSDILQQIPPLEIKQERIRGKFMDLCEPVIGNDKARQALERIDKLEDAANMKDIAALF